MGHLRLGVLPKTRPWNQVVGLLESSPSDSESIAIATLQAANRELERLKADPLLAYCFWLLTRITWLARKNDFISELDNVGISVAESESALSLISAISDQVRDEAKSYGGVTTFREIANLALKQALSETILVYTPDLFGSTLGDIQSACKKYSSKKQFGLLSRRYFSSFIDRFLRYFIDKEISNHIGPGRSIKSLGDGKAFTDALKLYAWQSSKIVEDYASGWYSKQNWETEGDITLSDAKRFMAYAFEKFQMELTSEDGGYDQ
ncbi:MAG: hypothetical protein ACOYYU_02180 [Chloroflexota bacterium]